jgi:hypothetical protein
MILDILSIVLWGIILLVAIYFILKWAIQGIYNLFFLE